MITRNLLYFIREYRHCLIVALSSLLFSSSWFPALATAQSIDVNSARINVDFTDGELGTTINAELNQLDSRKFSGCILVASGGKIVAVKSLGNTQSNLINPLTPNALFEVASVTKAFTATSLLILSEQGKLNLDASIAEYLPKVPNRSQSITVRQLMQHRSGIPGDSYGVTDQGLDKAVASMLRTGPRSSPGTKFEYWNQGYILLSQIVANVSGKSFEDFVRESIFAPCNMQGSCFLGDPLPSGFVETIGTGAIGQPRSCLEHPYNNVYLTYVGAGGLVSNVLDLWKFDRALQSGKLLSARAIQQSLDHGNFPYGLGWFIGASDGGIRVSHGGAVRGYKCDFRRYPESDSCIVVLCNRDDEVQPGRVADRIEELLFPRAESDGLSVAEAQAMLGKYQSKEGRQLIIEMRNKRAYYTILWAPNQPNGPVSQGYVRRNRQGQIEFHQSNETSLMQIDFPKQGEVTIIKFQDINLSFTRVKDEENNRTRKN